MPTTDAAGPAAMLDETAFETLAEVLEGLAGDDSRLILGVRSEDSTFARFNRGRLRQFSRIAQSEASLTLEWAGRQIGLALTLCGEPERDLPALRAAAATLRERIRHLPEDPHLATPPEPARSRRVDDHDALEGAAETAAAIAARVSDDDFVGFLAAGPVARGVADSRGMRHWHRVASSHLDYSLQHERAGAAPAAAVKSIVAGPNWDDGAFAASLAGTRERLALSAGQARTVPPGAYRVYLGPMAVAELLACMAWSGFSRRDRQTGTSALSLLVENDRTLSPAFDLAEAPTDGLAPAFTAEGHPRAGHLPLIEAGRPTGELVSPRSAAEFGLTVNADGHETPGSLSMTAGTLPAAEALAALGDGLWIENLWYLNYSDRRAARVTGMSRFASYVVEGGRVVAPLAPMRFDDSLLRLFGEGLQAVTRERSFLPDGDTWGARSLNACRCPGLLVSGLRFTL